MDGPLLFALFAMTRRMLRQMVVSTEIVLAYYLGFGFVTLLGWVIAAPEPGHGLSGAVAARYLRWSRLVGVVGIMHPALGFAIRDVVDQVGMELPDDRELDAKHARASRVVNVYAMASVVLAAAILIAHLGA